MTDKQFQLVINKTLSAFEKYKKLLEIAEDEYERRFGVDPSSIDDDHWIDAMHSDPCPTTVTEVTKFAKFHRDL